MDEPKPEAPGRDISVPDASAMLSPNILHSAVLERELRIKIDAYDLGILTLQSELDGAEEAKNKAIAKIETEFAEKQAEILRRIDDLTLTKEMHTGALAVRERRQQERVHAETDTKPYPSGTGEDGGGAGHSGQ